jgi:hypothetical protein
MDEKGRTGVYSVLGRATLTDVSLGGVVRLLRYWLPCDVPWGMILLRSMQAHKLEGNFFLLGPPSIVMSLSQGPQGPR